MKRLLKLIAILFFAFLAIWFLAPIGKGQEKTPTAAEKFKNIRVLNDMPADQLGKAMNMMSSSLGVNCSFCHVSGSTDFEKDDNEHKGITREMIAMTFDLNKRYFEGRPVITCNTCHNGMPMPGSDFPLTPSTRLPRLEQPAVKPSADMIVDRYIAVIGGKEAIGRISSRTITARRIEPDGKTIESEKIWQIGERLRIETAYGDYVVAEVFDGKDAWKTGAGSRIDLKPDEIDDIRREAKVFAQPDLKRTFVSLEYLQLDRIGTREADVLIARDGEGSATLLYFDRETGLLVRRRGSVPTVFGEFVSQMDYSDYRDFGGVKIPTQMKFAVPGIYWTRVISDIKINENIEQQKFVR